MRDARNFGHALLSHPMMRFDLRGSLTLALWAFGAGLISLAALDLIAHDHVTNEVLFRELRLHPAPRGCGSLPSPWRLRFWLDLAAEAGVRGRVLVGLFVVGGGAAILAGLRCLSGRRIGAVTRLAVMIALGSAGATALIWLAEAGDFRASLRDLFWTIGPDLRMRRLGVNPNIGPDWRAYSGAAVGAFLAALLFPAATLAAAATAVRRRAPTRDVWLIAASIGLGPTIAAVTLTWVHMAYLYLGCWGHFEAWPTAVATGRTAIVSAAALAISIVGAFALRRPMHRRRAPRTRLAAAFCGLGAILALATGPHRAAIDDLFPAPDRGRGNAGFSWVDEPWTIDVPRVADCHVDGGIDAVVRVGVGGQLRLEVDGGSWPLPPAGDELRFEHFAEFMARLRGHEDAAYEPTPLALLADRRIPVQALLPILDAAIEAGVPEIHVQAAAVGSFRTAEGRVTTWNVCTIGRVDPSTLHGRGLPLLAEWGDIVADPGIMH